MWNITSKVLNWDPGPWKQSINYRRLLYLLYCCYGISGMSRTCSNVLLSFVENKKSISIDFSNKQPSHFCGISGHPNVQTHSNLASKLNIRKTLCPPYSYFEFSVPKIAPRINTQRQWCDIQQQDVLFVRYPSRRGVSVGHIFLADIPTKTKADVLAVWFES